MKSFNEYLEAVQGGGSLTWKQKNEISLATSGGNFSIDDEESEDLLKWINTNEAKIATDFSGFIQKVNENEDEFMGADTPRKFKKLLDKLL